MKMRVGILPYDPGFNPYQRLFSESLVSAGVDVERIPNARFYPISKALKRPIDLLHIDWHHLFYARGRMPVLPWIRKMTYLKGLDELKDFPLVWTAHEFTAHDAKDRELELDMTQRLIHCCNGIIVMSHAAENLLRQTYNIPCKTNIIVVPHGHYIDVYDNTVSVSQARQKFGIRNDAKVILFLGRILPYKGVENLIDAFSRIADQKDALILAGPVSDMDYAKRIRSNVDKINGKFKVILNDSFVPDNELQDYFNASDLMAVPFKSILNSGSVMLAMSFGRAVVAPELGSIPEIFPQDAYFGYDPNQKEGLTNALAEAFGKHDLIERGAAVKRYALEQYGWKNVGQTVKKLYEEILCR